MSNPKPPRWLKPMNKFMMALQKLGIPTGPPMVLTVPGRKTGRPRSTPMTPFTLDGQLYGVAGFPGADWALNARAARGGTLGKGRKARKIRITELTAEQARPVLRVYPIEVPVGIGFLNAPAWCARAPQTKSRHSRAESPCSDSTSPRRTDHHTTGLASQPMGDTQSCIPATSS